MTKKTGLSDHNFVIRIISKKEWVLRLFSLVVDILQGTMIL